MPCLEGGEGADEGSISYLCPIMSDGEAMVVRKRSEDVRTRLRSKFSTATGNRCGGGAVHLASVSEFAVPCVSCAAAIGVVGGGLPVRIGIFPRSEIERLCALCGVDIPKQRL